MLAVGAPMGSWVTPILPEIGLSEALPKRPGGQLRMNTALPD